MEKSRSALLAIAGSVLGIACLTLVASVQDSPFHPLLPSGERAPAPVRSLASAVGLDSLTRDGLAGAAIVVLVLASAAFLFALRAAWNGGISVRAALLLAVGFNLLMLAVPLLMSRDVYSYAMYGKIAGVYHQNPYVAVPADFPADPLLALTGPKWNDTPAVYGPLFTLLSSGITRLIRGVSGEILAFRAIAVAGSIGTLFVIRGLVGRVRPERVAFAVVLFGWNPVVLFHSVASGHNDLLVALAIAGSLWLVWRGREWLAAVVLALGMLVKVTAALPLLLLVVVAVSRRPAGERLREFGKLAGISAATWIVFALPFMQTSDPTLGMVNLAGHEGWLAPSRLFRRTLENWLSGAGLDGLASAVSALVRIAFPLLLLLALVALVRHLMARGSVVTPGEQGAAWGWALLLLTLTGPVLLPWYIVWTLPLAFALTRIPRGSLVVLSVLFALSEVVAEPMRSPKIYEGMLIGVHYVITVGVFAVLVRLLVDLRRRLNDGSSLEPFAPGEEIAAETG